MVFCPNCEKEVPVEQIDSIDVIIRGETITVPVSGYKCKVCGDLLLPANFDELDYAFTEYRKRHGLMHPEEIRKVVEKVGINKVASILSTSEETLSRYIEGGLQTNEHDKILKLLLAL